MSIQIIDELIPKNWQEDLLESMKEVTWIHQKGTSYKSTPSNFVQGMDVFVDDNTIDTVQFVHYAILGDNKTFMFPYIKPMVYMLENAIGQKIARVHRVKINHTAPIPNFTSNNYNIAHSDEPRRDLTTVVYYINDSDGDTFIFNESHNFDHAITKLTIDRRVTPKMGSAVVFPSDRLHASSNPINTPSRYVINFVLELEK